MFQFVVIPAIGQNKTSSKLTAILIVGPLQDGTAKAIENMNKIADVFVKNGVAVYKFYDIKADWDKITEVSKDCSFFVYAGHGSLLGKNGNVGGLCLNTMVSTADLLAKLRLKNNALVIFKSVCYGAGSSASDSNDIGIGEAKKRVMAYAYPFFEIGAAAYYANNYENGVCSFLNDFFAGITLQQAYLNSTKIWTHVEFDAKCPKDHSKSYSIASSKGGGTSTKTTYTNGIKKVVKQKSCKKYDIAYAGEQDFSIKNI